MKILTGRTKVLGIIGTPLDHSLSPLMQNAALEALGLDYVYVPFPVAPEQLGEAIQGLKCLGVAGFNVTIPHKATIIPFLDGLSREAEMAGAVNTVRREENLLVGYNTDGTGLLASLKEDLAFEPHDASVLVIGAGGAARGALAALGSAGVAAITVANRSQHNAELLIRHFANFFPRIDFRAETLGLLSSSEQLQRFDLVLNTTSVGMKGTSFDGFGPASLTGLTACFYDMVYAPPRTPFLEAAMQSGNRTANGLGMLAAQGEVAFTLWTGSVPPPGLMKRCLLTVVEGN
jgi:shikimate dehydrogenase